jgi:hypothetical protein
MLYLERAKYIDNNAISLPMNVIDICDG